jgi:phosphoribosylformylglycinamidine cyclo-ligase
MTTYRDAGVDLDAAARAKELFKPFVRSTFGPQVLGDIGLFGGLFKLEGFKEPVLVSSTDGVGTKLKLASWMGRYDTIGHDVVNQSINDVLTTGARPLFFLDYIAMEELVPERAAAIVKGIAEACRAAGCALIGGETSQLSNHFQEGAFELCGFVVGAAERSQLLDPSRVNAGDLLIAVPASGLHTNGYSLVRHVFGLDKDPSPLFQRYPDLGRTLGEALLEPHRSYYPLLAPALPLVKSMGHITGDGLEDNVARAIPAGLRARIDYETWQPPALFRIIQERGNVAREEMFRVFNMGVGMVMTCERANADALLRLLPEAWVMGEVGRMT